MHLLLGCCGSVASIKISELVEKISSAIEEVEIRIVITKAAWHFLKDQQLQVSSILTDDDEWVLSRAEVALCFQEFLQGFFRSGKKKAIQSFISS